MFTEISRNVHVIKFPTVGGWSKWFFEISDIHFDSIHCDRQLLTKHLDEALARDAIILIRGDWFDVMQGRSDKRGSKSAIREEYKEGNYYDLVIKYSADYLAKYSKNIGIISPGNHETAILRFHETNVIERLVERINMQNGTQIKVGGYSGWNIYRFCHKSGGGACSKRHFYHHGSGGNARRSKGTLDIDIDAMKYPDADIVSKGHTHDKWLYPSVRRFRINESGKLFKDHQYHLRLGSYKDGLEDGSEGYEVEKNFNPTKLGGWFIKFEYINQKVKIKFEEAE